ncbi:MAG: hypothetical protein Q4F84_07565, partial [Fibrobacter sp.]|nr:hypothetical protein [Fibrobacter sp.]
SGEQKTFAQELLTNWHDGRVKMFLIFCGLELRNKNRDLFAYGQYTALSANGKFRNNIIAFARKNEEKCIIAAVSRFVTFLADQGQVPVGELWEDTFVENKFTEYAKWKNVLTNETVIFSSQIYAKNLFETFPAAILVGEN